MQEVGLDSDLEFRTPSRYSVAALLQLRGPSLRIEQKEIAQSISEGWIGQEWGRCSRG